MNIQATPAKLRSGSWGARIENQEVWVGAIVTITTRAGKSWDARVSRVAWTNGQVTLCATERVTSERSYTAVEYCGYPCPVSGRKCCSKNGPCHDCE